jgi:hypothetical protein
MIKKANNDLKLKEDRLRQKQVSPFSTFVCYRQLSLSALLTIFGAEKGEDKKKNTLLSKKLIVNVIYIKLWCWD